MTCTRKRTCLAVLALVLAASGLVHAQNKPAAPASAPAALPTSADLLSETASKALTDGDADLAIRAFGKLVELQPTNTSAMLGLAEAYMLAKNSLKAVEIYNRCGKLSPNDWRPDFGLGSIYLQQTYYKLAKPYLEKAMQLAPARADARGKVALNLAMCLRGMHNLPAAIDRARTSLGLDPTNVEARRLLITLYGEAGRTEEALAEARATIDMLRASLATTPDDRSVAEQLVHVLALWAELLQKLIEVRPDDPNLRLQLADAIEQLTQGSNLISYHNALVHMDAALKAAPQNAEVLFVHGRLQYLVGRHAQAAEDLRAALKIAPEDGRAKELLAKIESQAAKSADK